MAYFPFFVELSGRRGLIVGGGRTALAKARRLLDYGPLLRVVAPAVLPELAALPGVTAERRPFRAEDITEELSFVVAATDDAALNGEIAALCRARRVPVNVVDAPAECGFLFPALLRRGSLSVGVCTGGNSPALAARLRDGFASALPEDIEGILDYLGESRALTRRRIGDGERRRKVNAALLSACLRLGRPLTAEETEALLAGEEA